MNGRSHILLASAVVLLVGGGGALAIDRLVPTPSESHAPASASIGGPFTLVAGGGKTVTDASFRGKWMLVYFGYTFCPDACPTTLTNMSLALRKLGPLADRIAPLFISVDPKRDTPKVMANYVKSFDPRILGLTGTPDEVAAAARAYHVYYAVEKGGGADYVVDHSSYVYVMNPEGKFVKFFAGSTPGDQMAALLAPLLQPNS
jgi:protein SCO1/2